MAGPKCTDDCPKEPHYHIDDSGPICDGADPHPDWCVSEHVTIFKGTMDEAIEQGLFGETGSSA